MKKITKQNFREIESNYSMAASYYEKKSKLICAAAISHEDKVLINEAITTAMAMLKTAREKLHSIEYKGMDFTVYTMPAHYHKLDEMITDINKTLVDVNAIEPLNIDYSKYFEKIKEIEKESE